MQFLEFFERKSLQMFLKQNISYQLDKGFRLKYKLSYRDIPLVSQPISPSGLVGIPPTVPDGL